MFGDKSLANPGDYLAYYLGKGFEDESLKCCCCKCNFCERYEKKDEDRKEVPFCKYFGPVCYVKYNEGENIEDVFEKAKVFNNSKDLEILRKKFFDDAKKIKSYKEADVLVKTYLKNLKGLFCDCCIQFVLLTFDTKEYHEFRNKSSEVSLKPNEDNTCAICQEDMKYLSGNLMCSQCKHCFHKNCITAWLSRKEKCPMCNAENPEFLIDVEANQEKKAKLDNCLFDRKYYSSLNLDKNRFCVFPHGNGKGGRNSMVLDIKGERNQWFGAAVEWLYDEGRSVWVRYNNGINVYENDGTVYECRH